MAAIDQIKWDELSESELGLIIERAEQALEQIKKQKFDEVQEQIRQLATSVGMSPEEVIMQMSRGRRGSRAASAKGVRIVRYRNPEDPEQTWTGRGKHPNWLREKLQAGANLEDFKV